MSSENENRGLAYKTGYKVDFSEIPLSEHPRPSFRRNSYLTLNGKWDLKIINEETEETVYNGPVMVPYAVESPLSGVNHFLKPDERLIYTREVTFDPDFNEGRMVLHFEGVDQEAWVYVNNILLSHHVSGYMPFEIELPLAKGVSSFFLRVEVKDVTDASYHTRGKQTLGTTRLPFLYSSSSGIVFPVYLESTPVNYIKSLLIRTDFDKESVIVNINASEDGIVKLQFGEEEFPVPSNKETTLKIKDFHPWSKEDPYLYPLVLTFKNDVVYSYFGLRKIEIKEDQDGKKRLFLNNKPLFLSGLLDQGYYYLGNLTPKSYEDYMKDIDNVLRAGFNCLRKHVKYEIDRFYYLCDKAGLLLIQDFPNGGSSYNFLAIALPRPFPFLKEKQMNINLLGRKDEEGKKEFEMESRKALERLSLHPSILIYTIFNEGWGEFSPSFFYHQFKTLDQGQHLFDTASGWYDADSDFYSIHTYTFPNLPRRDKKKRAFLISECGGIGFKIESYAEFNGYFGHSNARSAFDLEKKFTDLYLEKLLPQIKKRGLNGIIYTEVSDCETEYNGLWTFDRQIIKIKESRIKEINDRLFQKFHDSVKSV